jgi:hypothetical protein
MSLPLHLRSYKEKSKDELARDYYNIPGQDAFAAPAVGDRPTLHKIRNRIDSGGLQGMDINAVLSVEGKEEVYVSNGHAHFEDTGEGCMQEAWSSCS